MRRILLPLLLAGLAACDAGEAEVPEAVLAARREADHRACLSAELARGAEEDVRTLEGTVGGRSGPGAAALAYGRAFEQHALLREAAYALADSAINRAASAADSASYAERVARYSISMPEEGTIEANVIVAYERRLAGLLADADHPCNWDLEEEAPAR